ncbi:hypothetical protein [Leisingera sp. ANG-DT]|uniref:hypothetical protein n=1 Tax=Leisingera sp. ANG-DT TaxID=1577897 RepID=UPI001F4D14BD|nr:hypothetical protein [Leisingera sp. ANG-DT]
MLLVIVTAHLSNFAAYLLLPARFAGQHLVQPGQLLVDMIQVAATALVMHLELAEILRKQACKAQHNRCFIKNYGLGLSKLGLYGHLAARICFSDPSLREDEENPDRLFLFL